MTVSVTTPVFEGPFDLLLHLITRDEVDIYSITLSGIVDAYITELERMEALDLELATEFLLIAATLVELKARRLLPGSSDLELDDELLYEERDLLLARLLECKTFKDAAAALAALRTEAKRSVPRQAGPEEPFASMAPDPLARTGLERFLAAARRAFTPQPDVQLSLHHVAPIRASVRDVIDSVLAAVPESGTITFRRLTEGIRDRIEIVVRFLAVLELYKRGLVELEQTQVLGALEVRRTHHDETTIDLTGLDEWDEVDLTDDDLDDDPADDLDGGPLRTGLEGLHRPVAVDLDGDARSVQSADDVRTQQ